MPQERIEGVKIQMSPNKKWNMDYQPGDMKVLYNRGHWHNWQEEIKWLQENGEADNKLTPGETVAMVEDLRTLEAKHEPFTDNWNQAYQMAHRYRAENNRRYAQEHAQVMEQVRQMRR